MTNSCLLYTSADSFAYFQSHEPAELFDVKETVIELPEAARIFKSEPCSCCEMCIRDRDYNEFLDDLEAGKISEVTLESDVIYYVEKGCLLYTSKGEGKRPNPLVHVIDTLDFPKC